MKKHNVNGSCNGHGCSIRIITLPYGSISWTILSRVYETRNDIQKVLPLAGISLDEKLAKEGQMEKMAS